MPTGFLHPCTVRKTLFRIFAFLRSPSNLKLHFLRLIWRLKAIHKHFHFLATLTLIKWRIHTYFLWFKHLQFLTFQTKCTSKLQLLEPITDNLDLINISCFWKHMTLSTDYGRPMKPLGIFSQTISTHFGTVSPLSMFSIIFKHYFYKKTKPLYPHPKERKPSCVRSPWSMQFLWFLQVNNLYSVGWVSLWSY